MSAVLELMQCRRAKARPAAIGDTVRVLATARYGVVIKVDGDSVLVLFGWADSAWLEPDEVGVCGYLNPTNDRSGRRL